MLTFCHIFKACSQDSNAVLAVMADMIQQLKSIMPSLTTVYYRQDNAGCYHCGHVIISSSKLGQKEGIVLKRLDFSDPQGGKGACDRKAATIKSHMRVFLNSGNDIETPEQMFKAMVSIGGVRSLNATLCEPFTSVETPAFKIDGVSLLSNIEYSPEGIRVWRAYGIGLGKIVYQQQSSGQGSGALPALVVAQVHRSNFSSIKGRTASAKPSGDEKESTGSGGEDASTNLFACPEDGCIKRFIRHCSVLRHLDYGKHQYTLEHETLYEKAAVQYAEQLEGQGATMVPVVKCPYQTRQCTKSGYRLGAEGNWTSTYYFHCCTTVISYQKVQTRRDDRAKS